MDSKDRTSSVLKKILLIENSPANISAVKESLDGSEYDLSLLNLLTDDSIHIVKNDLPHLVIMNLSILNTIQGMQLYKYLRNEINIPSIVISDINTGLTTSKNSDDNYDILSVPVNPVKLLASIEINLYKHKIKKDIDESESRSFALFNGNKAVMILIDPSTGEIREANKSAELFYGYTLKQFRSMNINQINIKQSDEILGDIQKILNGERNHFYFKHKLASGEIRDVEVYSSPVIFGGRTLLYSIIYDITQRKRNEEALLKREERYKTLIRTIGDAFFALNLDGKITEVNDSACEMLGYSKAEFLTKSISDLEASETIDQVKVHVKKIIENGRDRFESKLHTKSGDIINVMVNTVLVSNQETLLCFVTDITVQKKNEDIIRRSEERFRTIIDNADAILFSVDCNGTITFAEGRPLKEMGFEQSSFLGKSVFKDFGNLTEINECVRLGLEGKAIYKIIHAGDHYYKWSSKPQYNTHGEIIGIIGTAFDLTKSIEQQLRIKKLSQAVEQSQVSIVITDRTGNIEYVNPKFSRVTGYTFDEAVGQNPRILKSGGQTSDFYKNLWDTINSGKEWSGLFQNKRKDGKLFWEYANISPVVDENGEIINFIAVKEDITERIIAENELKIYQSRLEELVEERTGQIKKQNIFLKTLIDTIPNPIFVKDIEGKYTEVNKAFEEFFEVDRESVLGKTVNEYPGGEPALLAKKYDELLYKSHSKFVYETYVTKKNGIKIPLLVYKASFGEHFNKPEGVTGLLIDISQQKALEHQTLIALEKEKELNEMKTNFISMTSHEFRTPLTSILSSADLLEMYAGKWNSDKSEAHIKKIQNSVLFMTDLLDKVLTISRSERGLFSYSPQVFNLESLCREIVEESKNILTSGHNMTYEFLTVEKNVCADPKLISHILNNLITNAIKYSPEGGQINFIVNMIDNKLRFVVSDNGIGIPADEIHRLYEPFYRGRNSRKIKGSGLGLSIVKKAVDLHNGEISVKSEFNKGTEIIVELNCEKELSEETGFLNQQGSEIN